MHPGIWFIPGLMAEGGAEGGGLLNLFPLLIIFALFYFILIAPMRKKQKALQQMINEIKNGDKVITNGGIYGTVVGTDDKTVQLRIADQVKIRISKSAIAGLQPVPGEGQNSS